MPKRLNASGGDIGGHGSHRGRQSSALEPYVGKWVALNGPRDVLDAADDPQDLLAWLSNHEGRASAASRRRALHAPSAYTRAMATEALSKATLAPAERRAVARFIELVEERLGERLISAWL